MPAPAGPPLAAWVAPRLWPGETTVIIGCGPSLTAADVDYCRGKARVIAVNRAFEWAPWADALFACDFAWWGWYPAALEFPGLKVSLDKRVATAHPEIRWMERGPNEGLSLDPAKLHMGRNSAYQATNLAVHFGAPKIVLLGVDCKFGPKGESHCHPNHPKATPAEACAVYIKCWKTLPPDLAKAGVTVINASRETALDCFPRMTIEEALCPGPSV